MRKCCCQQSYGGLLWFECVLKPLYVKFNFKVSLLLGNKIIFLSIVDVSFVFVIIIIYIIIEMKFLQSFLKHTQSVSIFVQNQWKII